MINKHSEVDVVSDVLRLAAKAFPDSNFIVSLRTQYIERGSLSKKQLQGLHDKSLKAGTIPPGKLATLEAIIKKMRTRNKTTAPLNLPVEAADTRSPALIKAILEKFPQHKRVVYFKAKIENRETLNPLEISELEKFHQLLIK